MMITRFEDDRVYTKYFGLRYYKNENRSYGFRVFQRGKLTKKRIIIELKELILKLEEEKHKKEVTQ